MDLLLDESGTSNPVNTVIVSVALENGTDTEDNEGMLIDSSGGMVQMLSQNVEAEFSQQSENVFPEEDKIPGITLNSSDILKANDLDQTQVLKLNEDGTFAFLVTQDEEASGQGYLIQQQDTDLDESNNTLSQLDDNTMVFITECKDDPNNYEVKVENGDTTILPQSDVLLTSLDSKTTLNALSFDTKSNEGKKVNFCKDNTKKSASLFLCKTCDETFTSVSQLKLHERQHTGARVFKCDTCGKAFATAYGLKGHIRVHTNERPYRCKNCPKGFKTSGDLQKHTRTHTGERPFQCPFEGCEASFTTSNIRKVHIRRHTGEKPYKCQIEGCGKSFASATNYKNHNRIHTGEKPYQCNVMGCGKRFTEYSSLFKHNIVHTRNKPYECNLCQKTYRQTSTLSNHRKAMHGDHTMVVYDSVVKGSNVVGGALNKCGARMIPAITQLPLSLTSTLNTTTTVHSTSALNPAVSTPVLSTSIIKSDSSHNQPVVLNHGPMTVLKTIVPSLNICDKQDRLQTSEDEEGTLVINTAETGLDMNQIMPTHPTTSSTSTLLNLGITTQATEPSESDTGNQPYTMKLPTHGEQLFVVADTRLQTLELPAEVCTNDGASDILDDK